MSEQLTNTGVSGLLAMLGAAPAATGQAGVTPTGSSLPFGAIMQAQGAGFNPPQLDANGQPLPHSGGNLPPSGEMLAQMQAQIDAKTRAPELSQLLTESPDPDLNAALLTENQSLRDGVVMESQWPGVLPESTELSLDSPEVVALMQNAFEGHDAAQQRLSDVLGTLQKASLASKENSEALTEVLPQIEPEDTSDAGLAMQEILQSAEHAGRTVPGNMLEQTPTQVANAEAGIQGLQQPTETETGFGPLQDDQNSTAASGQSVESVRPELSTLPENSPREATVNPQQQPDDLMAVQEELNIERVAAQVASTQYAVEAPVVDSQSVAAAAAAAIRESQPVRSADVAPRASVADAVTGVGVAKDSLNAGSMATQLATPAQSPIAPGVTSSAPGQVLALDGAPAPAEGRSNIAADVVATTRQEPIDSDAPLGTDESADGWLRTETRAANQTNVAVDNLSRMTPSQAAFTLAGKGQMGSPAWNQALSERVMVMTAQNNQVAEIQLDPPELGSLKVRLQVGQDQVSVSFTSPHASVRDAVEQSMPRLREMMEEQGLNLGESSVNDQSSESGEEEGRQRFASQSDSDGSAGSEEAVSSTVSGDAVSLVDYYA